MNNFVVVMKDPATGEEKNLTMPGPRRPAENSCRRFKAIGMENIFVAENKKKKPRRKNKPVAAKVDLDNMPENEEAWINTLVKNLEVDRGS